MLANRSIAFKLILIITICSACIFTAIFGYNYYRSRIILKQELESNARNLALASVNHVETVLSGVVKVTEGLARSLEYGTQTDELRASLFKATLTTNPQIYGCGAAFEPRSSDRSSRPHTPYFRRGEGGLVYDPEENFQYLHRDWYQISWEMETVEWTEPYYDGMTNTLMASCSAPFYETTGGVRRLSGVAVSDISLEWLTKLVGSIKVLKSGYAFLISRNGTIVTHPASELIMNETIFSLAEVRKDPALRNLGRKMVKGGSGFIDYTNIQGVKCWLYYAPIPSAGWTLAVVFPEAELFAQIKALSLTSVLMGLAGIFMLAVVVTLIARSITTPLNLLAKATSEIAGGNFDVELPAVRAQDEVGTITTAFQVIQSSLNDDRSTPESELVPLRSQNEVDTLTHAFQVMQNSLKDHIRQLTETTAAKERIESELNIAHNIQMGLLHKTFPPFPDRQELDLFALMQPAKEVGGDFYDFFFVDDTHLCFVIADVSGKGVPAALFMAMSMTVINATARYGLPPEEVLFKVNNELARENDSCMFVTTFFGILDIESGELIYANGGHNQPLHLRRDGTVEWLPTPGSLIVGVIEDAPYQRQHLQLEPGDSLFLYTDGVTEAMNTELDLFSEKRLEQGLACLHGSSIKGVVDAMMVNISNFTDTAPQSDDITMMVIQYRGKS